MGKSLEYLLKGPITKFDSINDFYKLYKPLQALFYEDGSKLCKFHYKIMVKFTEDFDIDSQSS